METAEEKPTRGSRRKQRNRERLITAAAAIMARKGVDAATIAEITEEADLGFGTFYNHFESKEAIVDEVLATGLDDLGDAIDRLTENMEDPARVLSTAIRHLLATADRNPVFAWFVLRMPDASRQFMQHFRHRAERDVRRGVEAGRFRVEEPQSLAVALAGIILEGTRAKLSDTQPAQIDEHLAAYCLRLLGVDEAEATELARMRLPPMD